MRTLTKIALVVRDYDEAIRFYTQVLGWELCEDKPMGEGKRWVTVQPSSSAGAQLVLAKGTTPEQQSRIGNQSGGRVFLFVETDDLQRDVTRLKSHGVHFVREPAQEPWGRVAIFEDLYGNKFDLIEPNKRT